MQNDSEQLAGLSTFNGNLNPQNVTNEEYELFDLETPDNKLVQMLVNSLPKDISHWQQVPWQLQRTDIENINYILGDQIDQNMMLPHQTPYVDNRLFASTRAILAYTTGQTAKPSILPSKTDDKYQRVAKNMEVMLYQHALDHGVNDYMRLAAKNLITRKRGLLKLRYDPNHGPFGDIITTNVDPSNIIYDRFTGYKEDPNKIYERMRCTIEELIAQFPDKEAQIKQLFGIIRGTHAQMTRMVTYYECWFSYWQGRDKKQAVAWFLPNTDFILGKMQNPNWIYREGDEQSERVINLTYMPIKPYVLLNYLNTGQSAIDETCLLDQAIPLQNVLNKRGRQIVENADYANPRTLVDKRVMSQADADRFVNKNPKTIGLVNTSETGNDITKAVMQIPATMLPSYVVEDKFDARNEIDAMMGTPSVFRGEQPGSKSPTLGQDLLVKNQAGALQDDIVDSINDGWRDYYTKLLQMMRVYLPDDYWVMTKGEDGEYAMITLTTDNLDSSVRMNIQTDSTLPLDKQSQRSTAIQLAQIPGRIDDLSLFEMLGLPDATKLAERVQRYNLDRLTYMQSIETQLYNAEAEADITLITAQRPPEDRDTYAEEYLTYWNNFVSSNRFMKLDDPTKQRLLDFLQIIADKVAMTEALQDTMLDPSGMLNRDPAPPAPKVVEQIQLKGNLDPQTSAGLVPGGAKPPAPSPGQSPGQPSPPKVSTPPPM